VDWTEYVVGDQEDWIIGVVEWWKIERGKSRIEDGELKMVRRGKFKRSLVVSATVVVIALLTFKTFAQEKVKFPIGGRQGIQ
jgi:hypothetical protein